MADTYIGECKMCCIETDLIHGICGECALKKEETMIKDLVTKILYKEGHLVDWGYREADANSA
ncbi:hypothetical protein LCGC14_2355160, partial [marine sediment metagenome]